MNRLILNTFRKTRTHLVVFKYTLSRGYVWLQVPTLGTIGAGVIKPYFPQFKFWQLVLFAVIVFYIMGWLDRKLELVHEEQSMVTKLNPMLMKGLYGNENKKS